MFSSLFYHISSTLNGKIHKVSKNKLAKTNFHIARTAFDTCNVLHVFRHAGEMSDQRTEQNIGIILF